MHSLLHSSSPFGKLRLGKCCDQNDILPRQRQLSQNPSVSSVTGDLKTQAKPTSNNLSPRRLRWRWRPVRAGQITTKLLLPWCSGYLARYLKGKRSYWRGPIFHWTMIMGFGSFLKPEFFRASNQRGFPDTVHKRTSKIWENSTPARTDRYHLRKKAASKSNELISNLFVRCLEKSSQNILSNGALMVIYHGTIRKKITLNILKHIQVHSGKLT